MKKAMLLATSLVLSAYVVPGMAQDAIKADAKHYKVEFENDQVRVLRATYAAKEKSSMHEHPGTVAVFITDGDMKMTGADGKASEVKVKAGSVQWNGGTKHMPENVGDKPFEVILVEVKGKPAAKK